MDIIIYGKRKDLRGTLIEKDTDVKDITNLFVMPKKLEIGTIVFDKSLNKSWIVTKIIVNNK